jgi:protein transport protein SEC61 subunit gamma-like protein
MTDTTQDLRQQPLQIAKPIKESKTKNAIIKGKNKVRAFYIECKRVLKVTKRPDKLEFRTIVKISGLGMVVVGFIGFLIHIIKEVFF